MAKNFKKGLSLALAALMCAGTMNVTALAATCEGWHGNDVNFEVKKGENSEEGYTYLLFADKSHGNAKSNYYYYETSTHTLKKEATGGGAVHLITLIDTNENKGDWKPDGLYECGESNYDVVYCCDAETGSEAGNYYKRLNLEDSEYFTDEQAEQLRAIVENSYPYVSVEEAQDWLEDAGFEYAAELDRSEMIAATQAAIWSIANTGCGDSYEYNKTAYTGRVLSWGGYLHDYSHEITNYTNKLTSTSYTTLKDVGERIDALRDFLLALEGYGAKDNQIVITDMRFSEPLEAKSEDLYTFELTVELNQGADNGDNIVIETYVDGKIYGKTVKVNGDTEYTVDVEAKADSTVKVVVSGTQYLEKGVYFYAPEGGRDQSQNLIGVDEGETPVYAEAEMSFEKVTFKGGTVSNISYMFINKETGEVDFIKKIDVPENATSAPIITMEGYVSVMFMKQATSGMFWFSEKVKDAWVEDAIECLEDNNPSYKGYNAIAYGEGAHDLEFKKGKVVTYSFIDDNVYFGDVEVDKVITEEPETVVEKSETYVDEDEAYVEEPAAPAVNVKGAEKWTLYPVSDITVVYVEKDGKVPAVIWTDRAVDAAELAAIKAVVGADDDAKVVSGFGSHKIEYQHNKNKTKTVTYTFE